MWNQNQYSNERQNWASSRPLAFSLAAQTAQKKLKKKRDRGGKYNEKYKEKNIHKRKSNRWEEEEQATKFKPCLLSNRPKEEYSFKVLAGKTQKS